MLLEMTEWVCANYTPERALCVLIMIACYSYGLRISEALNVRLEDNYTYAAQNTWTRRVHALMIRKTKTPMNTLECDKA